MDFSNSTCTSAILLSNTDVEMKSHTSEKCSLNPVNTEFLYYSALLKELAPKLTEEKDRQKFISWIKKIFRPEYHSSLLKLKRNKYLLFMIISVLNDEAYNILQFQPPLGAVPDIETLELVDIEICEWEVDDTWDTILKNTRSSKRKIQCAVHKSITECQHDHRWDEILDEEFQYLLYLARPYYFMTKDESRAKAKAWFEILCSIKGPTSCSTMKGIRNDYIMILLGYLQDLNLLGPFASYPMSNILLPLSETCKLTSKTFGNLDPTCKAVDEFLTTQPRPTDGAICYLAVTGELINNNKQTCGFS